MKDIPEKITCTQIQGSQVEKLELYSVGIKDLGQRSDTDYICAVGQVCQWSIRGEDGGEESQ